MTGPGGSIGVAFPAPNLGTLTDKWVESLVLPPDPNIPAGTRLWHRRTADGYLSVVVSKVQGTYQVQVLHKVLGRLAVDGAAVEPHGRPPTIDELAEILSKFTRPQLVFMMIILSNKFPMPPWQNPVIVGLSQVGQAGAGPLPADLRAIRS